MWKPKDKKPTTPDEKKVRSFGIWQFLLVTFIVLWMVGAYVFLEQKTRSNSTTIPVVVLDNVNGVDFSNFTKIGSNTSTIYFTKKNELNNRPDFECKDNYSMGDIVVVKYFYVEAVVIDKSLPSGNAYTILYKDHNHVLQKIILPKEMLMAPAEGVLNPVSLLVD